MKILSNYMKPLNLANLKHNAMKRNAHVRINLFIICKRVASRELARIFHSFLKTFPGNRLQLKSTVKVFADSLLVNGLHR